MLPALGIEVIENPRQARDRRLVGFNFAVENAQGVGHRAALAVRAEFGLHALERTLQDFHVLRAAARATHGIDEQSRIPQAQPLDKKRQHF